MAAIVASGMGGMVSAQAATCTYTVSGNQNMACGDGAAVDAGAIRSTAIGQGAQAGASGTGQSIAIGSSTIATGDQSTALGNNAAAQGASGIAIGGDDVDRVANKTYTATINGVTETKTGAQLFTDLTGSTAIAAGTYFAPTAGDGSVALGPQARAGGSTASNGTYSAQGVFDIAIGTQAYATGFSSIALGTGALALKDASFAIGAAAKANGNDATAFGSSANAIGNSSFAMGHLAKSTDEGTIAFGAESAASAANTISFGFGSAASATNAIAFGANAQATAVDSMAFGPGAIADGAKAIAIGPGSHGTKANDGTAVDFSTVGGHSGNIAGAIGSAAGVVSFGQAITYESDPGAPDGIKRDVNGMPVIAAGGEGVQRQLQNVAPGRISDTSTDAVNGSQLNVTNQQVTSNTVAIGNAGQKAPVVYTDATGNKVAKADDGKWYPASQVNPDGSVKTGATEFTGSVIASMQNPDGSAITPTTLANVAPGTVAAGSTQAINGGQLYATNNSVANALGGGAKLNADGTISGPTYSINGKDYADVGSALGAATTHYYSVNSAAIGAGSNYNNDGALGLNSIAAGVSASTSATATYGIAIGGNAAAIGDSSIAIGKGSGSGSTGSSNFALGVNAGQNVKPDTSGATCVFPPFYCDGATGNGTNNTAYGNRAGSSVNGALNIGIGWSGGYTVSGFNNIGIGALSGFQVAGSGNTGIGSFAGASVTGDRNTGLGNAAGGNVIGSSNTAVGNGAGNYVSGTGNLALGPGSGSGTSATALTVDRSTAIGNNALGYGNDSVALGTGAVAGVSGSAATVTNDIAIGNGARATGGNSISIGSGNVVSGANSGAFGDPNTVSGAGSYALGNNNTVAKDNTFVLGNGVSTTQDNSVVLGNASSDRAATTVTSGTIAGTAYTYAGPGSVANGVVSVGAAGKERQVINVAAGAVSGTSTDAINGSQLYATNQAIGAVNTLAGKGWKFTLNGGAAQNIAPGGTIGLQQGSNIALSQSGGVVTIATSAAPTFTSVTAGNTVLDNTGVTVSGGPNGPVVLGNAGLDNGGNTITNVAAGSNPSDAVNVSQLQAAQAAATTHYYSVNDGGTVGGNYNNDGATGTNALAAGVNAQATNTNAVAMGSGAFAKGSNAVSIGTNAGANPTAASALGNSIFVGSAAGRYATDGGNNIGIGTSALTKVSGAQNTAIGYFAGQGGQGSHNVIIGEHANISTTTGTTTSSAVVVGQNALATGNNAVAIGGANGGGLAGAKATGQKAVALGVSSQATGDNSIAQGYDAQAMQTNDMALGTGALASGGSSIAQGTSAKALGGNNVAIGNGAAVQMWYGGATTSSLALGVNAQALNEQVIAIGAGAQATGDTSTAIGLGASTNLQAQYSTAIGTRANTLGLGGVALGNTATAGAGSTQNDVAIGSGANASGGSAIAQGTGAQATASQAIAIGNNTKVSGIGSMAFGAGNTVSGDPAGAFGSGNTVSGNNSYAFGNGNTIAANNAFVMGNGVTIASGLDGAVALGNGSTVTAANTSYYNPGIGTLSGVASGVVSVGAAGSERQIQNVAPGANATDAVNVSQLQALGGSLSSAGLDFTGNDATAGVVHRNLGQTLAINGGATTAGTYSGANLKTVTDPATGAINIQMAENPEFSSVKTGNTTMSSAGVTVNDGTNSTSYGSTGMTITGGPSVTTAGVDAGGKQITHVASGGTTATNAANIGDVQSAVAGATYGAQQAAPVVYTNAAGDKLAKANDGKWYLATAVNPDGSLIGAPTAVPSASVIASMQSASGSTTTATKLGNVADGTVAAGSHDAVNGSQLNTTNQAVGNLGNSVATGLGGTSSYDASTGTLTTGLKVGGTTYTNVNDALNGINAGASAGWNVTTGVAAGSSGVANGSSVANVAPGATHTIQAGNNIITTQNGTSVEIGVNPNLTGLNSVAIVGGPTLNNGGIAMNGTKITNLAPGTAASDAATVGQINTATNKWSAGNPTTYVAPQATGTDSFASGSGAVASGQNSVALGNGSVADRSNAVSVGAPGQERQVTNVAPGSAGTDAVNVNQMAGAAQQAQSNAQNYTDQRINGVYGAIDDVGKRADAGVAGAMATASLPQPYRPGQSMVGAALGGYHGQAGIAVGVSTITDNGSWVFKANVSGNTQGNVGVGVGAGFVW